MLQVYKILNGIDNIENFNQKLMLSQDKITRVSLITPCKPRTHYTTKLDIQSHFS